MMTTTMMTTTVTTTMMTTTMMTTTMMTTTMKTTHNSTVKEKLRLQQQPPPQRDSTQLKSRKASAAHPSSHARNTVYSAVSSTATLQDIQRIYNGAITLYTQQRFTAQLMLGKYFQETKRWKDAQQDQQLSSQDRNSFLRTPR